MSWKSFAKRVALGAALALSLSASKCDNDGITTKYAIERVPDEYRRCFAEELLVKVKNYETDGKILWKDAQRLIVDLTADRNRLYRCGTGAVAWADAQAVALNRYLGQ